MHNCQQSVQWLLIVNLRNLQIKVYTVVGKRANCEWVSEHVISYNIESPHGAKKWTASHASQTFP